MAEIKKRGIIDYSLQAHFQAEMEKNRAKAEEDESNGAEVDWSKIIYLANFLEKQQ